MRAYLVCLSLHAGVSFVPLLKPISPQVPSRMRASGLNYGVWLELQRSQLQLYKKFHTGAAPAYPWIIIEPMLAYFYFWLFLPHTDTLSLNDS